MADFLATNEFAGTGGVMQVEVQFAGYRPDDPNAQAPYLSVADVEAEVLTPVSAGEPELAVPMPLVQINALTFQTTGVVPVGKSLRVRRSTEIRWPLVDFQNLQVVTEKDLDVAIRQVLYVTQENQDIANRAFEVSGTISDLAAQAEAAAQEAREAADEAIEISNQAIGDVKRSVRVESTDPEIPTLPSAALRANKVMGFDSLGNPAAIIPASGSAADVLLQLADPAQGANLVALQDGGNVNDLVEQGAGKGSNRIHYDDGKTLEDLRVNSSGKGANMIPHGTSDVGTELTALTKLLQRGFGANQIPYEQRTVADALADTCNVRNYGAVGDGNSHPVSELFTSLPDAVAYFGAHVTSLSDERDWAAAVKAVATGLPKLYFPGNQSYLIQKGLTIPRSVHLVSEGATLRLPVGMRVIIEGGLFNLPALASATISKTTKSVTFSAPTGLQSGDVLGLHNPTSFSWSPHRAYYTAGEMLKVHSVSGNLVNFYGGVSDVYQGSSLNCYRYKKHEVMLENINFFGDPSTVGNVVCVRFATRFNSVNSYASGTDSYGMEIDRCYNVNAFYGGGTNFSPYFADDYGMIISNCSRVNIVGGEYCATRHCIALGGGAGPMSIPCRDVLVSNMTLTCWGNDVGSADMHGNVDRVRYINCNLLDHGHLAGRDVGYYGCYIRGRTGLPDGMCLYGSELVGGIYTVHGCVLDSHGTLATWGAIHCNPAAPLKQSLSIRVSDTVLRCVGGGTGVFLRSEIAHGSPETQAINLRVSDCEVQASSGQFGIMAYLRNAVSTSAAVVSDGIYVDDIIAPAGTFLNYGHVGITNVPVHEMRQRGQVRVTAVSGSGSVISDIVSFRYNYSRLPVPTTGWYGVGGVASSTVGSRQVATNAYSLTTGGIRIAAIAAATTFAANQDIMLTYDVGLTF